MQVGPQINYTTDRNVGKKQFFRMQHYVVLFVCISLAKAENQNWNENFEKIISKAEYHA